tara:strand:- start:3463 stop:4857 length:1395 start_codon:yes stop_codon:yes gene_type:complete
MAIDFRRAEGISSPPNLGQAIRIKSNEQMRQESTQHYMNDLYNRAYDIGEFSVAGGTPQYSASGSNIGTLTSEWNKYKQYAGPNANFREFAEMYKTIEDQRAGSIEEKLMKMQNMGFQEKDIMNLVYTNPTLYRDVLRQASRNPQSAAAAMVTPRKGWMGRGATALWESSLPSIAGYSAAGGALRGLRGPTGIGPRAVGAGKGALTGLRRAIPGMAPREDILKAATQDLGKTADRLGFRKRLGTKAAIKEAQELASEKWKAVKGTGTKGKLKRAYTEMVKANPKDKRGMRSIAKLDKSVAGYKTKIKNLKGDKRSKVYKQKVATLNKALSKKEAILKKAQEKFIDRNAKFVEKRKLHKEAVSAAKKAQTTAKTAGQKYSGKLVERFIKKHGVSGLISRVVKQVGIKGAVKLLGKGILGAGLTFSGLGTGVGLAIDAWTIYEIANIIRKTVTSDVKQGPRNVESF